MVRSRCEVMNQHDETVLTMEGFGMSSAGATRRRRGRPGAERRADVTLLRRARAVEDRRARCRRRDNAEPARPATAAAVPAGRDAPNRSGRSERLTADDPGHANRRHGASGRRTVAGRTTLPLGTRLREYEIKATDRRRHAAASSTSPGTTRCSARSRSRSTCRRRWRAASPGSAERRRRRRAPSRRRSRPA